jgi:MFS family permease
MTRPGSALDRTFQSLRTRNYRLYFFGQIISLTGTWMQSVGQAWLVLKLTRSGVALGIVTGLQFLPVLLAGAWGGVVADRVDKRKLIIATQTAAAALALVLGILTVTGAVRLWMVYALAVGLGLVNLMDMPARQSFVFDMVGREDVTNAVSLNSVVVNGSRVVGPAVAGILIATVGIGICFLVNAASYVAVIAGLYLMDPARLQIQPRVLRARGQLRDGLRYVWRMSELRTPILLMAAVGMIAYNFSVLFPLLVKFTFERGAGAYGTLFSLMGVGAVMGGLVVAARSRATPFLLAGSTLALGALLWLSAAAPSFWVEMIAVVPVGAASTVFIATSNAMLQLHSAPHMRGRVMALFMVVFLGTTPIGGPVVGWIAQRFGPRFGPRVALAVGATVTLIAGLAALAALARKRRASKLVQDRPVAAGDRQAVTAV